MRRITNSKEAVKGNRLIDLAISQMEDMIYEEDRNERRAIYLAFMDTVIANFTSNHEKITRD